MIEADLDVAVSLQRLGGSAHLRHPLASIWKRVLVDQPLMRLEPGDMGITEQSEARGRERRRELGAADHVANGLARKPEHQVDIDVRDADGPERRDGLLNLLERLDAT